MIESKRKEGEIDSSADGYRWRKYGRKRVKGGTFPRSYYRCTSAGCPAKKFTEAVSQSDTIADDDEGLIEEVDDDEEYGKQCTQQTLHMGDSVMNIKTSYKGEHNHPAPLNPHKRSSRQKTEDRPQSNSPAGFSPFNPQSFSNTTSYAEPLRSNPPIKSLPLESLSTPNAYQAHSDTHQPIRTHAVQGYASQGYGQSGYTPFDLYPQAHPGYTQPRRQPSQYYEDDMEDQQSSKKQKQKQHIATNAGIGQIPLAAAEIPSRYAPPKDLKVDQASPQPNPAPISEESVLSAAQQLISLQSGEQSGSRKVVKATIDGPPPDGYQWRKYGQKAVKGSPYSRSYYRCSYSDCKVKKNVERSASEPNVIIHTYEGLHTHPAPDNFMDGTKKRARKAYEVGERPLDRTSFHAAGPSADPSFSYQSSPAASAPAATTPRRHLDSMYPNQPYMN
eukprot:TRINITY_DN965_c0_g1_i1.p1 TRINITY_DN965_c0_g1~~TRINITY_DN965_c0_g1_i1.p1  ORF type:complete len:446 (-),score=79.43 TRINITY_DN965_c0_g1_i1:103-1440(-)